MRDSISKKYHFPPFLSQIRGLSAKTTLPSPSYKNLLFKCYSIADADQEEEGEEEEAELRKP